MAFMDDAPRNLKSAIRLLRLDGTSATGFENTPEARRESFAALPLFWLLFAGHVLLLPVRYPDGTSVMQVAGMISLVMLAAVLLFQWLVPQFLTALQSLPANVNAIWNDATDLRPHAFLAAFNWSMVVKAGVLLVVTVVSISPLWMGYGWVLRDVAVVLLLAYSMVVARTVLNTTWFIAMILTVTEFSMMQAFSGIGQALLQWQFGVEFHILNMPFESLTDPTVIPQSEPGPATPP